jgi:hypothetical protein
MRRQQLSRCCGGRLPQRRWLSGLSGKAPGEGAGATAAPPAAAEKQQEAVAGVQRIVAWAKQSDAHLRALEERISGAEAHRQVLQQRMKGSSSEGDLNSLVSAMQTNTSELLSCYREHKVKADNMLLAVLAVCGGSVLTLVGSMLSHWRARREQEALSKQLNTDLGSMLESKMARLANELRAGGGGGRGGGGGGVGPGLGGEAQGESRRGQGKRTSSARGKESKGDRGEVAAASAATATAAITASAAAPRTTEGAARAAKAAEAAEAAEAGKATATGGGSLRPVHIVLDADSFAALVGLGGSGGDVRHLNRSLAAALCTGATWSIVWLAASLRKRN